MNLKKPIRILLFPLATTALLFAVTGCDTSSASSAGASASTTSARFATSTSTQSGADATTTTLGQSSTKSTASGQTASQASANSTSQQAVSVRVAVVSQKPAKKAQTSGVTIRSVRSAYPEVNLSAVNQLFSAGPAHVVSLKWLNPETAWMAGEHHLYVSMDGGQSWNTVPSVFASGILSILPISTSSCDILVNPYGSSASQTMTVLRVTWEKHHVRTQSLPTLPISLTNLRASVQWHLIGLTHGAIELTTTPTPSTASANATPSTTSYLLPSSATAWQKVKLPASADAADATASQGGYQILESGDTRLKVSESYLYGTDVVSLFSSTNQASDWTRMANSLPGQWLQSAVPSPGLVEVLVDESPMLSSVDNAHAFFLFQSKDGGQDFTLEHVFLPPSAWTSYQTSQHTAWRNVVIPSNGQQRLLQLQHEKDITPMLPTQLPKADPFNFSKPDGGDTFGVIATNLWFIEMSRNHPPVLFTELPVASFRVDIGHQRHVNFHILPSGILQMRVDTPITDVEMTSLSSPLPIYDWLKLADEFRVWSPRSATELDVR